VKGGNPLRAKTIAFTLSCIALTGLLFEAGAAAQRASPHEMTSGTIDGAMLTITYGRPSARGRKIMGGLVPFGEIWTPGADEATTLMTSAQLKISNVVVPAGEYSMWMLPLPNEWALYLNKNANLYHTANRNVRQDLPRIHLLKRTVEDPTERLTFSIEHNASGSGGVIKMLWENTELIAPVTVAP
jgi:hypothetical protein